MPSPRRRTKDEILDPAGPEACNIEEATVVLGVSRKTIHDLIDSGHLHAFPVGRSKKIGRRSLRRCAGLDP